ncbi:MAG: HAD-IIIA family hydrolase [Gaiellales bacterium]
MTTIDVVIPTVGRSCLGRLLASIERERVHERGRVIVVDDRPGTTALELPGWAIRVAGRGAGPAAARNRGWNASDADWIAFLDDDTELTPAWLEQLESDIGELPATVAASQGRIVVPRPTGRKPTDGERAVIGLETARYASADICYRRSVLELVGGFDERFPRAYREDSDIALRVLDAGFDIVQGGRTTLHRLADDPARSALRRQAGNRDDVLMAALHGRGWRERCGAPRGRLRRHLVTSAAGAAVPVAMVAGRRSLARALAAVWLAGTAELAWARIAPGPRTRREVTGLLATSLVLPPLAVGQYARGLLELPRRLHPRPDAVLLDRDGTLVVDVPHNGDPAQVRPMPGAQEAVARLRRAGVPTAVVTNQSGIARGFTTADQVQAVNRRVEQLFGPLGPWFVCPHRDEDGCDCRKPEPGMLLTAARSLGADPARTAMIGDTGADMEAARRAGLRGVLVPTAVTLADEVANASEVASDLAAAVDRLLGAAAT